VCSSDLSIDFNGNLAILLQHTFYR
jgi:hypothetical protein